MLPDEAKTTNRFTIAATVLLFGHRVCSISAVLYPTAVRFSSSVAGQATRSFRRTLLSRAAASMSGDTTSVEGGGSSPVGRGAFILFEGVDRCGKTTQANLLVDSLKEAGHDTCFMRFPGERTLDT